MKPKTHRLYFSPCLQGARVKLSNNTVAANIHRGARASDTRINSCMTHEIARNFLQAMIVYEGKKKLGLKRPPKPRPGRDNTTECYRVCSTKTSCVYQWRARL